MTGPDSPRTGPERVPAPDPHRGGVARTRPGPELTRRRALQVGGLGLLGVTVGAPAWARGPVGGLRTLAAESLREPETLHSEDGLLRVRLEVAETSVTLAGRPAHMLTYNGTVPGPTLRLRPGDRLQIELVNRLSAPTNLHTHGLHVSPKGNADNTLDVHVHPGESFRYDIQLPDDHPPGPFWYHPHEHHLVADQIWSGLYGGIVVEDAGPEVPVTRDRLLVVSDTTLDDAGHPVHVAEWERVKGREGQLVLVNGQLTPTLEARPGERERWRIVNACTSRFLRLRLDGHQMDLLATDIGRLAEPRRVEEVEVLNSGRVDVLVTVGERSGELQGLANPRTRDRDGDGPSGAPGALATLQVTGTPVPALPPVPAYPQLPDLRGVEPAARRTMVLGLDWSGGGHEDHGDGHGTGGMVMTIDGRPFDPARTDQVTRLGTVEEWTYVNRTGMDHPLHLHVWPMQLVAVDGRPVEDVVYQDVVRVPAGGETTVRIPFEDFDGRTVFHCHINDHEDAGMMAVVEARNG
ncbi:multicopper oxidase family protein [Geodermatophilus sp. URMC 61]|uniref:multicopper oxidase family protein n=1 Tax=Geodermatophilus sp. URMC 61 TaxID=3423411 RepID=UPI00406CAD31